MEQALRGQVAIVTGAGRGIGRAVAKELAAAGARVVLVARSRADLQQIAEEIGEERAAVLPGDVADEATAAAAVDRAMAWEGRLDAVINNAGVGWTGSIQDMPLAEWRRLMDTNLTGMFLMTRAALRPMVAAGRGHIVNVASGAGRLGAARGAAYSASKFAVIGFTESVGLEVRNSGVKVSVVEPGSVHTSFSPGTSRRDWALRPDDVARAVLAVLATGPNVWIREAFVTPLKVPTT